MPLNPEVKRYNTANNLERDSNASNVNEIYLALAIATCFTLCAIKTWCAAAVESVHSVCAGPVVLAGMTCTVIDICFRR